MNKPIYGIEVDFPYPNAYPSQMALMSKAMKSFVNQENGILESPTGSGKSLALLSSSLAYQAHMRNLHPDLPNCNEEGSQSSGDAVKYKVPQIWFSSRTHTQLSQLVSELRKLKYRPKMSILASRKQTCVFSKAIQKGSIDQECQILRKSNECPYFHKSSSNSIPKDLNTTPPPKFDIEELKDICKEEYKCPYTVSKALSKSADIVFSPYNYIIHRSIREQMSINLKGAILIIDEAHNIEQACREAASLNIVHSDLLTHQSLWNLSEGQSELYPNLVRPYANVKYFLDTILEYFASKRDDIDNKMHLNGNSKYVYEDDTELFIRDCLKQSVTSWNLLYRDFQYICKADQENDNPYQQDRLPNQAFVSLIRSIFDPLDFLFSDNGANFRDFKFVYQYEDDPANDQIRLICLSPSVVFKPITSLVHCVILTSGTLSPIGTFLTELGTTFTNRLSASHVISPSQVVTITLSNSPSREIMSSKYADLSSNGDRIFLSLADIMKELLPTIPGGVLFFLPSYSIKNKVISAWEKSKDYEAISKIKRIFVEKQGAEADKKTLRQYKEHIKKCRKFSNSSKVGDGESGGLYIAVCRGKVSEGMDFHDDQARAVIIFGIPYPSLYEPDVILKRKYNDEKKALCSTDGSSGDEVMSGNDWYETQAFRAIFQAVGRCIRHKDDFGSVILIDRRFEEDVKKFPSWVLRSWDGATDQNYDNIKTKLMRFYGEMSVKFPMKKNDLSSDADEEVSESIPFNLTCADCTQTAFTQVMLKLDSTMLVAQDKKGFLKVINEDKQQFVYIMKDRDKKEARTEKAEGVWSKDDLIFYEPVLCKTCNKVLGAKVIAASGKDISLVDSYLLHLDKFYASQKGRSQPLGKIVKKPKIMSLKKENTGDSKQARLSFT